MVTLKPAEIEVKAKLENYGYTVYKRGAPDFLCFKGNPQRFNIHDVLFVEVKSNCSPLANIEQLIWLSVLSQCGLKSFVVNPDDPLSDRWFNERLNSFKKLNL